MEKDVVALNEQLEKLGNLDELAEKLQRVKDTTKFIVRHVDGLPDEGYVERLERFVKAIKQLKELFHGKND
jgi:antirestriction protein ArdC